MLGCGVISRVLDDAFADRQGQIQPAKLQMPVLEVLHDAQRMQIVIETQAVLAQLVVERALSGMAKGRMPDIVRQRQRLGQVLIQPQRARHGPRNLRHFHGVGQAAAEVIGIPDG